MSKDTITNLAMLDLSKSYTVSDYLSWQFDEMVELIKGKVFTMSPAPRSKHQAISQNINGVLYNIAKKNSCKVFYAPFDVYLSGDAGESSTVVQPDISVICERSKIHDRGCVGAPDMIVEILSPSTLRRDIDIKYHLYEENFVQEYWIVVPDFKQVSVYFLNQNTYQHQGDFTSKGEIPINIWPGKTIEWEEIFYDVF